NGVKTVEQKVRMQLALKVLKFGMGELHLQLRRYRLTLHSGLVKVDRLIQSHNQPVGKHASKAHRQNTDSERREKAQDARTSYAKNGPQKSKAQNVFGDRYQRSHDERRDGVDRYMSENSRPRQREPFGQSDYKRCVRRP